MAAKKTTAKATTKTGVELAPKKTAPTPPKPTLQEKLQEAQVIAEMPKRSLDTTPSNTVVNAAPSVSLPADFWSGVKTQDIINQFNTQYNSPTATQKELANIGEAISGTPEENYATTMAKNALRAIGLSESLISSAIDFYKFLSKDGITDADAQSQLFFYNKDYTNVNGVKIVSPFYNAYGKFREYAGIDYTEPAKIVGYVDGIKDVIKRGGYDAKFYSDENIIKYMQNSVDVAALSQRAVEAKAAALTTDAAYVDSLMQQGYINKQEDLANFYLDPTIGEETFQRNKLSATIGAEAIRRATPVTPTLTTLTEGSKAIIQQAAARYRAAGYTDRMALDAAETAYKDVAANLEQTTKLAGIYEGQLPDQKNITEIGRAGQIQQELEKENLLGIASQRRKKLAEMGQTSFMGSSGTAGAASFARQIQL